MWIRWYIRFLFVFSLFDRLSPASNIVMQDIEAKKQTGGYFSACLSPFVPVFLLLLNIFFHAGENPHRFFQEIFSWSRNLSEIMAINSELVGLPRPLWMV